jgi:RNA polymerase sigma-70 factor (ECF subfamily)
MHDGAAEAELLLKAARGDESAFLLLYERHRTSVFRFACRMIGSAGLAEDVTQECFLSVLRRPEAFCPERASLRTYLCGIARHLAFRQLRKRGQDVALDDPPQETPGRPPSDDPLGVVLQEEEAEAVRRAVAALPPLQREVVVLFEYEQMSLAEIAVTCGIDVGTVKARLHRARQRLRRTLASSLAGAPAAAVGVGGGRETRP